MQTMEVLRYPGSGAPAPLCIGRRLIVTLIEYWARAGESLPIRMRAAHCSAMTSMAANIHH